MTTIPEDILSVVKSHLDVARERLPGSPLTKLIEESVKVVGDLQEKAYARMMLNPETELEELCSMINDANRLQSELPQLLDHYPVSDSAAGTRTRRENLQEFIDDVSGRKCLF